VTTRPGHCTNDRASATPGPPEGHLAATCGPRQPPAAPERHLGRLYRLPWDVFGPLTSLELLADWLDVVCVSEETRVRAVGLCVTESVVDLWVIGGPRVAAGPSERGLCV